VEYQLTDSKAETIIALDSLYPIVEKVWQKTKLKNAVVTSLEEYASKTAISPSRVGQKPNVYSFQELLKEKGAKPPKVNIKPKEDLAALQYTGGTTGTAKGAMLTHLNLVSNAIAFAAWIKGTAAQETFLTALPLFHIYGMTTSMNVPILLAAKMVLLPRFDPVAALESIQRHRVTVFCGVPTMYSVLLANPELGKFDLTSIRVCISGASPLPPQVQKKFMQITSGFLAEGYGLTEASPVTHCNPVDKTMRTVRLGSIGLPLPDTDARIVDVETGEKTLEPGETGELTVKGPQVMKGYWNRPEETALVLRNGWLLTGDIAKMDRDGYFYITDRKKDLIKYKDYSVYPREIEDVIYEHSAVKLCAVVGKPSPTVGEIPKAFIVLKDGAKATEAEVMAFVNEKVAPYKAIREMEFRKELPVSAAGKVLRRVLQQEEEKRKTL
jgi:long-chain acyl-CoA synthetase